MEVGPGQDGAEGGRVLQGKVGLHEDLRKQTAREEGQAEEGSRERRRRQRQRYLGDLLQLSSGFICSKEQPAINTPFKQQAFLEKCLITVVGGHAGDGVHVLFDGADAFTALVDSFPLKTFQTEIWVMQGLS